MNDKQVNDSQYRERVYEIVRQIPVARVMTYGQIAQILGAGYTPRTVGFVMHGADTKETPWQRVINSQGACSTGRMTVPVNLQQQILEVRRRYFQRKRSLRFKDLSMVARRFRRRQRRRTAEFIQRVINNYYFSKPTDDSNLSVLLSSIKP